MVTKRRRRERRRRRMATVAEKGKYEVVVRIPAHMLPHLYFPPSPLLSHSASDNDQRRRKMRTRRAKRRWRRRMAVTSEVCGFLQFVFSL